jgi:dTDP-4-amino-4,6-dideoxygalactose transaminase
VEKRRAINQFYRSFLGKKEVILFHTEQEGMRSNYWLTSILIEPSKTKGISRDSVRLSLEAENIESRPLWKPMHLQPVFSGAPAYTNGFSEHAFNIGLCLPSGSNLLEEEKCRIKEKLLTIFV